MQTTLTMLRPTSCTFLRIVEGLVFSYATKGGNLSILWSIFGMVFSLAGLVVKCVEPLLFLLVDCYDKYVYNPLQSSLSPLVQRVPREVMVGERKVTVFTANIVSYARTVLVIPIAVCLKYQLNWVGCLLVLLHDFLDHVDGIVAKVQRRVHGNVDDPLLGGFMDAFVIRELKKSDETGGNQGQATAAVMEGKLKEKLESMGIAFLCVAQSAPVIMNSISGISGVVCLFLSIRLAHASLSRKLSARKERKPLREPPGPTVGSCLHRLMTRRSQSVQVDLIPLDDMDSPEPQLGSPGPEGRGERYLKDDSPVLNRSLSVPVGMIGHGLVDKVYTVGCFDLFHSGHVRLLQRMRSLGKQVIVGVHDSRSIYMLKKRVPVDSTEKRMLNVKQYADIVYCIAGIDPSNFIACVYSSGQQESSLYVRGDDMENFPARQLCEKLMPIAFLPYTQGVSSTKLRKEIYNATQSDPRQDFDANLFY